MLLKRSSSFILALVCLSSLALPSPSWAAQPVTVKVMAPTPVLDTNDGAQASPIKGNAALQIQQQIGKILVERIKLRLEAAGLKDVRVSTTAGATISVTVYGDYSKDWLYGVIVPVGRFGLHPVGAAGTMWQELESELPKQIALREPGPGQGDEPYLWSKDRAALEGFIKRVALPQLTIAVAPDQNGWRTVALRPALLNESLIKEVALKKTAQGTPFGMLLLHERAKAIWKDRDEDERFALVLDGEVLSIIRKPAVSTQAQLQVMCATLAEPKAQERCVSQIVGRLAAPLPTPLVPTI